MAIWGTIQWFKLWLKPGKKASEAIFAIRNSATINVEKMGFAALLSPAQGKKT